MMAVASSVEPTENKLLHATGEISGPTQDDPEAREDPRLLHAIAGEDQQALATLYRRRGGLVFSFLVRMLGDQAEAQEVLQDTFIRLWRRAPEFDAERSSATAWLLMFARGLALDRLRARSRRAVKISAYENEAATFAALDAASAHRLEQDELADVCRDALARLPEPQGRALQLAFFRGWTHEEIAEAQGEALGTIKARIRRGLLTLRKTMKDYYG
jgi:RNA polymerase sigma-70 factor (ECF subfamily)